MKKTYLARRNALFSSSEISWGGFALVAILVLLLVRLLAPNLFWRVVSPLFTLGDAVSSSTHIFFSSFENVASLSAENEQLRNANAALANENKVLSERALDEGTLLGTEPDVTLGVIARPPASPYDALILSGGSNAGAALGMEAFGPGGIPVGVVSGLTSDYTRVTLFSSPGLKTDAWVGGEAAPLAIEGSGAGSLRASVPRALGVKAGDTVYVAGPGKLPVGTVVRVVGDPTSPENSIQIQLSINLFELSWVELRATGEAFAKTITWTTPAL